MDSFADSPFLVAWHSAMLVGAIICFIIGAALYLLHHARVAAISDYHQKYNYINTHEIKWYKWVFLSFGIGVGMLINLYGAGQVHEVGVWFFVRVFMGIAGATAVGYIASLILEYYYPTKLNKKLRKWRYATRLNSKTGNEMRLLSESEEDVHLEEGKQAEENIFTIDYDVWIDEQSKDVKIEKYKGHLVGQQCGNCGFYTMRVVREEISELNADSFPKEVVKHYQCSYCKSVRATAFKVSRKEAADYINERPLYKFGKNIDLVKIEIHSLVSGKLHFEFQNIEQAQKFLSEYDVERVG
jgi:hypothetical protein